ncbi:MAG: sigma-70 family RNA polymerase sigma factor [Mediterranea sp.]|nr:sigma-70 family RNA polymerase sigma factor [Mediterranea sp.]
MKKRTDKEWLEAFAADKERAFRAFFDYYYVRLCMYAVQLTDDFSESEDIVQSFFITFWEQELFRRVTVSLRNYAYLSVRHAALRYLEKSARLPLEEALADDEYLYVCEEMGVSEREAKEQELRKALDELPEQERNVLRHVVVESKSYKEAAAELDISVNTLKTHLSRALKRLRENKKLLLLLMLLQ